MELVWKDENNRPGRAPENVVGCCSYTECRRYYLPLPLVVGECKGFFQQAQRDCAESKKAKGTLRDTGKDTDRFADDWL